MSQDMVGVSVQFQAAVSIHISLSNIPQISSLLQQPSQARTQGRTTRTWRGWLRKQHVTKSRARSSIPFGGLPKCSDLLGREGKSSSLVCSWVNHCLESWSVCSKAGR